MTDDDDRVFKALADPTRRFLLDRLFARDGRTLTELESELEMTRFGVMKHLRVLEDAGLVVARKSGREKLHYLNPVPIRLIHDRWIDKYTERRVSALAELLRRSPHVLRVLAGHVHRGAFGVLGGCGVAACPSTNLQTRLQIRPEGYEIGDDPPAMLVHALLDGELVSHVQPVRPTNVNCAG